MFIWNKTIACTIWTEIYSQYWALKSGLCGDVKDGWENEEELQLILGREQGVSEFKKAKTMLLWKVFYQR